MLLWFNLWSIARVLSPSSLTFSLGLILPVTRCSLLNRAAFPRREALYRVGKLSPFWAQTFLPAASICWSWGAIIHYYFADEAKKVWGFIIFTRSSSYVNGTTDISKALALTSLLHCPLPFSNSQPGTLLDLQLSSKGHGFLTPSPPRKALSVLIKIEIKHIVHVWSFKGRIQRAPLTWAQHPC